MVRSNVTIMATSSESAASESSFSDEVSKLMGKGRRHLVCNEVVQAVKCFEEATQKLDGKYGTGADECGEAYLFFGKALLELARAENGVLGNALKDAEPKSEESSDEDEEKMGAVGPKISEMSPSAKDKIREDVQDAMAEKKDGDVKEKDNEQDETAADKTKTEKETKSEEEPKEKAVEEKEADKDGDKGTDKDEKEEKKGATEEKESEGAKKDAEEGKKGNEEAKEDEGGRKKEGAEEGEENTEEGKKAEEDDEAGDEDDDEDDDEDMEGVEEGTEGEGKADGDQEGEDQEEEVDVPTMQLAWEFLELARIVFVRQENKEAQLNLAEVHLKLGEIKLEQEQFVNAVEEFQSCLDLQTKHLEADDRLIAETSYSMGLAYSLQPNYSKAHEFFSKALECIKLKTSKLEARVAEWESKSKGKGKASDKDPCVVDRKELEELQNLYPEIKARVDDAQEMMNSAPKEPDSETTEGFGTSDTKDVPATTIPIKQTATLIQVRRKRKPEEESSSSGAQDTEVPVKKARQEEEPPKPVPTVTENGHDPSGNGTATSEQK
nr:histone-binding protein N1/N2-like [Pocillopora verrucosa]